MPGHPPHFNCFEKLSRARRMFRPNPTKIILHTSNLGNPTLRPLLALRKLLSPVWQLYNVWHYLHNILISTKILSLSFSDPLPYIPYQSYQSSQTGRNRYSSSRQISLASCHRHHRHHRHTYPHVVTYSNDTSLPHRYPVCVFVVVVRVSYLILFAARPHPLLPLYNPPTPTSPFATSNNKGIHPSRSPLFHCCETYF